MISIGLPIYRQSIILPVALRGLSEQLNAGDWEIIFCTEDNIEPIVREWSGRLFAAGCKNIRIIKLGEWIPLPQKWRRIGRELHPDSVGMILQAADCYPHKNRIAQSRRAMNEGYDWYHERKGYFYDIRIKAMAEYYSNSSHTHLNMCIASRHAKLLTLSSKRNTIDGWMWSHIKNRKVYTFECNGGGVDLSGYSNISVERTKAIKTGGFPFIKTDKNIADIIKLPELPVVNVLTRTYKRPDQFKVCQESVINQTYENINHIVASEVDCDYAIKLDPKQKPQVAMPGLHAAPWNLHFHDMYKFVKDGWIIHIDDDDKFTDNNSVECLVRAIDHQDQLLLWRVNIAGRLVPSDKNFKNNIVRGDISGIGFMFHSKHLPVNWGDHTCGDYRVIKSLSNKLEVKWIDHAWTFIKRGVPKHHTYFTQTQGLPGATIRLKK